MRKLRLKHIQTKFMTLLGIFFKVIGNFTIMDVLNWNHLRMNNLAIIIALVFCI